MRGYENDFNIGQKRLYLFGKFHASHIGHLNIQQEQVIKESILRNVRQKIVTVCVSCYFITDTVGLQAFLYKQQDVNMLNYRPV